MSTRKPQLTLSQAMLGHCESVQVNKTVIGLLLFVKLLLIQQLTANRHAELMLSAFFATMSATQCSILAKEHIVMFNQVALLLHIEAKKQGVFINVSPCQPPSIGLCENCKGSELDVIDGEQVCNGCGLLMRQEQAMSWADVTRVQTLPRYSYDRAATFKEHILQLQGKGKIDIELLLKLLPLAKETRLSKALFAAKVKEISKQRSHVDQTHGLYYLCYGREPPALALVENQILCDFERYSSCFNQDYGSTGKPFTNNQLLLFHLLRKHGVKITRADMMLGIGTCPILKRIFATLGWRVQG